MDNMIVYLENLEGSTDKPDKLLIFMLIYSHANL